MTDRIEIAATFADLTALTGGSLDERGALVIKPGENVPPVLPLRLGDVDLGRWAMTGEVSTFRPRLETRPYRIVLHKVEEPR